MSYLLDTHILIWTIDADPRLRSDHLAIVSGPARIVVSVASIWEMSIKQGLGKLVVPDDLPERLDRAGAEVLDVTAEHARQVRHLPHHHRDPFDRMLVAQAQVERLTLLTADPAFAAYDIRLA